MTQQQVQQTILSAQLQMANMVEANRVQLSVGNDTVTYAEIKRYYRNISALTYRYAVADYTSTVATTLYDCLNSLIGFDTTLNYIDPNFQNPTIIIESGGTDFTPVILHKTEADLIDAGGGNWYLPYLDDGGQPIANGMVPVLVMDNNTSFTFQFDTNYTPPRIWGFGNDDSPHVIVVTLL